MLGRREIVRLARHAHYGQEGRKVKDDVRGMDFMALRAGVVLLGIFFILPCFAGGWDGAVTVDNVPQRKAGLWEVTRSSPKHGKSVKKQCFSAEDSLMVKPFGEQCDDPIVKKDGAATLILRLCHFGVKRQLMSVRYTGDYITHYNAQVRMQIIAAETGLPLEADHFALSAKFLSESCPPTGQP